MPAFFDRFERIDGKGMAQAMGSGWSEEDIAELFSWLSDTDPPNGMVKEKPHLLIRQGAESFAGQEVGILILGAETGTYGEVVFHLLHDGLGKRDQSIFSELGLFDVEGALFPSIVVLEQMQGFRDSHAASGHQQDCHVEGELFEKGGFGPLHSFADGPKELIDLLGREDERDDNLFFERRDIKQGILLKSSPPYQETKETPCDGEHMVHRGGLHDEMGSHVKEKGRV